jgi:hypothetical protein
MDLVPVVLQLFQYVLHLQMDGQFTLNAMEELEIQLRPKYRKGQKVEAMILQETITGIIDGIGTHKGRLVYDIDLGYGHSRFVYESQILKILQK